MNKILAIISCCVTVYGADANVCVSNVQDCVRAIVSELPRGERGSFDYLIEFGYHYKGNPAYDVLSSLVSNNLNWVDNHFAECATNDVERLVLLSASWGFDDTQYLNSFSNKICMATNGALTRREFMFFRLGSRNQRLLSLLPMHYDQPGVSNIVNMLQNYTGETNYCRRILSGAAKCDAIKFLDM